MYQNYNYYPQQNTQLSGNPQPVPNYLQNYLRNAQSQTGLKGRLVSSLEEARATSIDFDGSVFYFPDFANRRIYTKQINADGTATLNVYELKENPIGMNEQFTPSLDKFVSREEFEDAIAQLKSVLVPVQPILEPAQPQKVEIKPF
jgi:hypothetical protein